MSLNDLNVNFLSSFNFIFRFFYSICIRSNEFINVKILNLSNSNSNSNLNDGQNESKRINHVKNCAVEDEKLLKITEIPSHLRFNEWIETGYRCELSTVECLKSLTYFHNETVNILTHGIPLIYLLSHYNHFDMPWNQITVPLLPYFHVISCFIPWIGSSFYHIFMNHKAGEKVYNTLLEWDVIGIWFTQSFGASTTIYTSVSQYYLWFQVIFIGIYVILSLRALRASVVAENQWKRPISFLYLVIMRIFAFVFRLHSNSITMEHYKMQLIHVSMQEIWPILGAFISATRIPERFLPGYFDYIFNSHNIMHCFVIFGAIHMHFAAYNDLIWLSANSNQASQLN